MPHDALRAAQRCLDDLARCVSQLERQLGSGLEVRRVRSDAAHLRESLALLADAAPDRRAPVSPTEMISVPDAPYDNRLWADADDEGLGARHGKAP